MSKYYFYPCESSAFVNLKDNKKGIAQVLFIQERGDILFYTMDLVPELRKPGTRISNVGLYEWSNGDFLRLMDLDEKAREDLARKLTENIPDEHLDRRLKHIIDEIVEIGGIQQQERVSWLPYLGK